jgi:hypothetical protein
MTKQRTINLNAPHTPKQRQLITHPGSVVSFCGRRWGKTDANVQRIFYWMTQNPGLYWWVGLSWKSASMKRAWREVKNIGSRALMAMGVRPRHYINNTTNEITIPGLGEIWFRSAENPASLAGEGIRGAVFDEFTLAREIVWTEYLQATLLDFGGWVSFCGVPKGQNWGAALWYGAADKPDWLQLHATSYDNPIIDDALIDAIRDDPNTPEFFFRQEYLAEILSADGQVFRRINQAAVAEPIDGRGEGDYATYVAGVDIATQIDFTVVSVFNADTQEQVYMDRFNRVDYTVLEERLESIYRRFGLTAMMVEVTGVGRPVVDHLMQRGLTVIPFSTTNATKTAIIQKLAGAFEHGAIRILDNKIQTSELLSFEGKQLSGYWRYGAPEGRHDDTVMAMAIAWEAAGRYSSLEIYDNVLYG